MLIQGIANKNRDYFLIEKYNELLKNGAEKSNILIVTLNAYKKVIFSNLIQDKDVKIYTFQGLCYNSFIENKEYISNLLNAPDLENELNLCGLEISQFIFKQSIKEADFSDYISKVNLLHQLFRRYSLIVQNDLSNKEVTTRSLMLKESFYKEAQKTLDDYKLRTIRYKSFDYLRQMAMLPLIYKNTDYFKNIEYLIIDDADEYSYAFWQFIDSVMPNVKDYYMAYDQNGSSRCGYLCAYKKGVQEFKKNYNCEEIELNIQTKFKKEANAFFENLKKGEKTKLNLINYSSSIRRLDMIENVIKEVNTLLNNGIKQSEICIISPIVDDVLTGALKNIDFQIISGNEKLIDISIIKQLITLLKIVNGINVQEFEIKDILINLLKIPFKKCYKVIKSKNLTTNELENNKYTKLKNTLNSLFKSTYSLTEQIKILFDNVIKDNMQNYDIKKYEFLLKEAKSFEIAFSDRIEDLAKEFIIQIENSVISENPAETISINKSSILVGTPQKVIDYSLSTQYQFWLDISDHEWLKEDKGTLYNAWGFNRDWDKKKFTNEDNINLTRDKAARMVRKLMLLADNKISFYSSLYDNSGNENFGGLTDFIEIEKEVEKKELFQITPRDDQKPVLEYNKGKMGIMAVPGAGKTTILLALITKLIKSGIRSENIFVLTYMESAAKNFKERIKASLPDTIETPNISTIHGLALRIIKENANYTKVGLDENFEICDDNAKERIIKEIMYKLKVEEDNFDNYLRCISIVKLSDNNENLHSKFKEIQTFFNFYNEYNKTLKSNNLLDYDDMLYFAVKILNENKEILNYYQNICKYIIEDEAQDSSEIQQKLINLLAGKYNNIVRCGDINQAITSTFTNSDTEGFKNFLNDSKKVEMSSSQRCAQPIFSLANDFIKEAMKDENLKNSFYNIEMQGTTKNPQSDKKPYFINLKSEKEEKEFILKEIKEIYKKDDKANIAILLRLNSQVNDYNEFFTTNGFKTTVRTDCLCQKQIYKIILSILKVIQAPLNNKNIIELAKTYKELNICKIFNKNIEFIEELNEPFINIDVDSIKSEGLSQLYWDIDYWLNQSTSIIENIVLKIGLFYSKNSTDISNTYLVSTLVKRLNNKKENYDELIKQLEYSANRPLSAYKFFEEEETKEEGSINIMTMHKSKGDEFDYVFIPQLNEGNYPIRKENVKLKSGGHFVQTIKSQIEHSDLKTPDILKNELIYETLRLLYVGITRAKKELVFSSAQKYKRIRNIQVFPFFEKLSLETNSDLFNNISYTSEI